MSRSVSPAVDGSVLRNTDLRLVFGGAGNNATLGQGGADPVEVMALICKPGLGLHAEVGGRSRAPRRRALQTAEFCRHSALSVLAASCFKLLRNVLAPGAAKAGAFRKMRFCVVWPVYSGSRSPSTSNILRVSPRGAETESSRMSPGFVESASQLCGYPRRKQALRLSGW